MKAKIDELTVEKIFDLIMADKKMSKQEFAAYIGYNASKMSQKFGTTWDMHWRVFVKLLPDLVQLKIINPNLLKTSDNKVLPEASEGHSNKLKTQDNLPDNRQGIPDIMYPLRYTSFILQ